MQLSPGQLSAFEQAGFLLTSGLIDPAIAQRAYDRVIERAPKGKAASSHRFVWNRLVRACFTEELCSVARHLAGPGVRVRRPLITYAITVFPNNGVWEWPSPHIDHALEKHAHKTFPPAFHIGCLIYLNEVTSRSGGTVVWPGSHKQIEELAAAHRERYQYLATLNDDLNRIVFRDPVEITASPGDVLFYHHFLAHAGSQNTSTKARIALNHKW
jgi:Phytanoyl-CoA dioxygenase (PhyH)